jgi:hypothetical protein
MLIFNMLRSSHAPASITCVALPDHELLIEKMLPPEAGKHYPVCLAGKRACPPEDYGGVWGYAGFLEAIHDRQHPEHEEMLEWVGGEFDPDLFDLDKVNTALQSLK